RMIPLAQSSESRMRAVSRLLAGLIVGGCSGPCPHSPRNDHNWPTSPTPVIVPFPPGGTTSRVVGRVHRLLQADLKTPIVSENRSGASGSIGTQAAVAAPPDGTTFLLVFDSHAANPSLLPNLPFDTVKDLVPIMLIGTSPMVITAHPASEYR